MHLDIRRLGTAEDVVYDRDRLFNLRMRSLMIA